MLGLIAAGCGGGGDHHSTPKGEVSGVVYDSSSNPIVGARVYIDGGPSTTTNSVGGYVLENVPAYDVPVLASVSKNGAQYVGSNVASVYEGERAESVNIVIFPSTQQATLHGVVYDSHGNRLQGAKVFAQATGDTAPLSSTMAVSDSHGEYYLSVLQGGVTYNVVANGLDYDTSSATVTLNDGDLRSQDFHLNNASNPALTAPQNVAATAYTAPTSATRDAKLANAIEAVKEALNPKRPAPAATTRLTSGGNDIEIDLTWDAVSSSSLLGYGIYRSRGGATPQPVQFLRDPLAQIFEDTDANLVEGNAYNYQVNALSTSYDGGSTGLGPLSAEVTVTPLGDLTLGSVNATTSPTFNWNAAYGASQYAVLVYDNYPTIGETWRNSAITYNAGTSWTWNDAPLTSGRTYYYIVIGKSDAGNYSFSPVGQFTVK